MNRHQPILTIANLERIRTDPESVERDFTAEQVTSLVDLAQLGHAVHVTMYDHGMIARDGDVIGSGLQTWKHVINAITKTIRGFVARENAR